MNAAIDLTRLEAYDFALPPERIAKTPLPQRDASRLLVLERDRFLDQRFSDLAGFLQPGDVLVVNDSRVIHARLTGHKTTGGAVEVLIERLVGAREALAQVRASKSPKPGTRLHLANGALTFEVLGRDDDLFHLRLEAPSEGDLLALIERYGTLPLPPYLGRPPAPEDEARYQTVFAREAGSVAAPTAGLHFTPELLATIAARGVEIVPVTLHVGAGTFQPVRTSDIRAHRMHRERFYLSTEAAAALTAAQREQRRIVAVGTTALRTLEGAMAIWGELRAGSGETDLFIYPGFRFQVVEALVTNFHLPQSTLLMLVAAFAGYERTMAAYRHAVAAGYRFFSYGDAMFIPSRWGDVVPSRP